ncbi:FAD/FMN-containing dehydrogenase [Reticulomyxa filosa]|uniref:FAD/FMN-containing dehydrogenase n=1 Tax=Reticulomyxa filosa TaxID=46433 RepID=X6M2E9_RETFI|nr:FAD/FMN-containing dehydrogenase [Reticulomyxa filosa]|eukprot:ETO08343.1 FAD/FMN-containing dehydrogenase [Reticulomyxa filosa]
MFCCCRRTERRQDAKNDTSEDTLSTEDQKLVRAIHDKEEWDKVNTDVELIQDDTVFNNTIVSMGINGVIYSMYVEVVGAFFLEETRKMYTLEEFEANFKQWKEEESQGIIDRMEFWFSPYTSILPIKYSKSPPVVASFYKKTDKTPPPVIKFC